MTGRTPLGMPGCCGAPPPKSKSGGGGGSGGARARAKDEAPAARRGAGLKVPIVLLGEESSGKTSLVLRFVAHDFRLKNDVNRGAALTARTIMLSEPGRAPRAVQLDLWDTPGSTKLHHMAQMYYRAAEAAIVTYDVTSSASFDVMKEWIDELKSLGPADIRLIIAANKVDCSDRREVTYQQAYEYSLEVNAEFFEVSARTGRNVDKLFRAAAAGVVERGEEETGDRGLMHGLRRTAQGAADGAGRLARRASLDGGVPSIPKLR